MSAPARAGAISDAPSPGSSVRRSCSYALPLSLLLGGGILIAFAVATSSARIGTSFPGFLLMENRVVPSVSGHDWPPHKSDLFHGQIATVDAVASSAEVYERARGTRAGSILTYGVRKGDVVDEIAIATRTFAVRDYLEVYGVLLLIGLLNLVLGAVVGLLRAEHRQARVFFLLAMAGCCFATTPVFLHQPGFPLLTFVYLFAESVFPATFIHFAMVFPVDRLERLGTHRARYFGAGLYGAAALLTVAKLVGFYREPPDLAGFYVSYVFIATSFVVFFGSLLSALRRERSVAVQLRARALIPSVTVGGSLTIFAFLNNSVAGGDFPMQLGLVLVPLFYASVAYAIVAHDLFGIDRFVRWTFVYALLSVVVFAAYTLLASALPAVAHGTQLDASLVYASGFLALAILLDPLRRLAQRVVDRAYYRTPWRFRDTVSRVSREMTSWRSVERIADELTRVLTAEMQLESVTICLAADPQPWSRRADKRMVRLPAVAEISSIEALPTQATDPQLISSLDQELPAPVRDVAERMNAEIVVPLVFSARVTGLLLLGATRSRRELGSEDLDLLRTLAAQAAIAFENARSYEALEEHNRTLNETVRRRTAQLVQSEQLASLGQLVAGVAHELNNPVGAVHSSIGILQSSLEEIEELLRAYEEAAADDPMLRRRIEALGRNLESAGLIAETNELLDICGEGSRRVRDIVRDLLTFARGDRGDRHPVDVREGITSTLRLLGDRFAERGIEVKLDLREVPATTANPAQLNQVWMNLLTNAFDALAADTASAGEIRVSAQPVDDGSERGVEVEVADDGPGMPPAVLARVLEPFFTTKDVGKGTGLGLSIAYGIVRDHGGSIDVQSEEGRGTRVCVRLPARSDSGGAKHAART